MPDTGYMVNQTDYPAESLIHSSFPPMGTEHRAHEGSQSQAPSKNEGAPYYKQGQEALRVSREVRPNLTEE